MKPISVFHVAMYINALILTSASKRPPGKHIHTKRLKQTVDESFFMLPEMKESLKRQLYTDHDVTQFKYYLSGEKKCLKKWSGSSCPSHYRMNVDRRRRPKHIVEAACNCKHCLRNSGGKCKPVQYPRRVQRRERGKRGWVFKFEKITVGCSCKYPQELLSQQAPYAIPF